MAKISLEEALRQSLQATKNYIDDSLAQNGFSGDYNDLENRPVYDTRETSIIDIPVTFDCSLNGKEYMEVSWGYSAKDTFSSKAMAGRMYLVKVSNTAPVIELGDKEIIKYEMRGVSPGDEVFIISGDGSDVVVDNNYVNIYSYMFLVYNSATINTEFGALNFTPGLWIYAMGDESAVTDYIGGGNVTLQKGELKRLDYKYVDYLPGKSTEGETFTVSIAQTGADGYPEQADNIQRVAKKGAEIYNDYENNIAVGRNSHAEGSGTMAVEEGSHAEGCGTKSLEYSAHAEGNNTVALGNGSHAEGIRSIAGDGGAHAEGYQTKANGGRSHTEGADTETAKGTWYGHAEGYKTISKGKYSSHAEGYETIAASSYQHVQGKYNIEDAAEKYAHIVGNGTSTSNRKNAHTLDWSGNAWFAGDVQANNIPYAKSTQTVTVTLAELQAAYGQIGSENAFIPLSNFVMPEGYNIVATLSVNNFLMTTSLDWAGILFEIKNSNTFVQISLMPEDDGTTFMFHGDISYITTDLVITVIELNTFMDSRMIQPDFVANSSISLNRIGTIGSGSVAIGQDVESSGLGSFATGYGTSARSTGTLAAGVDTVASAYASSAIGEYTIASSSHQHVQGKFNIEDTAGKYAHIVGNGTERYSSSDGGATMEYIVTPSNAYTLDWKGNAWFQGKVTADGTPSANNDLTTKKYVDDKMAGYLSMTDTTSNTDLNTLMTTGTYNLKGGTNTNAPATGNATVFVNSSVGTPYQIFMHDATFKLWYRSYDKTNAVWREWGATLGNDISGTAASANKVNQSLSIQLNGGTATTFNGSAAKSINITPSSIGAAAASHGNHFNLNDSNSLPPTANGSAGTYNTAARGDHTHPLQTTVSGNAGTATKLQTARTLTVGNTGKTFDGSANVSWSLAEIGAIPLSGNPDSYNITGNLTFADAGTSGGFKGVVGKCGTNDYWRVGGLGVASNDGRMEIATSDDGNEPIYVRQYSGVYSTLVRSATLLDASGNTSFPGNVAVGGNTTSIGGKVQMQYNATSESLDFIFI